MTPLRPVAVVATSEIATREVEVAVIDCVALFYEEGKGGENYQKKKTSSGVG